MSRGLQVLEEVLGRPPLYIREGGTIPALALFRQHLGVDTTVFAFGLEDDRIHSPNERCGLQGLRLYRVLG